MSHGRSAVTMRGGSLRRVLPAGGLVVSSGPVPRLYPAVVSAYATLHLRLTIGQG